MKTRDAIYSREAAELLRIITTYKTLTSVQIYRLFPGKEEKTRTILAHLIRQGRVFYNQDNDVAAASEELAKEPDAGMTAAFWVLLDFLSRAEYHTASDFPVKISFFAAGEMYEIIYIAAGQETLISHALSAVESDDPPRRLIVVDEPGQAAEISVSGAVGFCVVAPDGAVSYYKQEFQ